MATKKYFCILDTETVTADRKVFDLGFEIIDHQGNVYEQGSFVVEEQLKDQDALEELITDYFTKGKITRYLSDFLNNGYHSFTRASFAHIRNTVNTLIKKYHATLCAYNIAFDLNALNKTSRKYCNCDFFEEMPELLDIWAAAMSTLCNTIKYIKFVAENSLTTEKGNPQTGAEAVYKFISQNVDFEEEHTAFKDCEIEAEILQACHHTHKKMNRETVGACMRNQDWNNIVKRYHEYTQD